MKEIVLAQGSQEWLAWRRGGIGASEVASLAWHAEALGFGEACPIDLGPAPSWLPTPITMLGRKSGTMPDLVPNEDMTRGNRMEPPIREKVEQQTGVKFRPFCLEAWPDSPLRASLDGVAFLNGGGIAILEIKAPRGMPAAMKMSYLIQVAYQRVVVTLANIQRPEGPIASERLRSALAAGVEDDKGTLDVRLFPIAANPDFEDWLARLVTFVWDTYVLGVRGYKPVPVVKGDIIYSRDDTLACAAEKYLKASEAADAAKTLAEDARKWLLELAGDFQATLIAGPCRLTRVERAGSIDYRKAVDTLVPGADLEPWRKPGSSSVQIRTIASDKPA